MFVAQGKHSAPRPVRQMPSPLLEVLLKGCPKAAHRGADWQQVLVYHLTDKSFFAPDRVVQLLGDLQAGIQHASCVDGMPAFARGVSNAGLVDQVVLQPLDKAVICEAVLLCQGRQKERKESLRPGLGRPWAWIEGAGWILSH